MNVNDEELCAVMVPGASEDKAFEVRTDVMASRPLPVLLEVNAGGEDSKNGFRPDEVPALADVIAALRWLRVDGLMTMAAFEEDPEAFAAHYEPQETAEAQRISRAIATLPDVSINRDVLVMTLAVPSAQKPTTH